MNFKKSFIFSPSCCGKQTGALGKLSFFAESMPEASFELSPVANTFPEPSFELSPIAETPQKGIFSLSAFVEYSGEGLPVFFVKIE